MAMLAAAAPFIPQAVGVLGAVRAYKDSRVKPTKSKAIPMPDDEEIRKAKRRAVPVSRGRASTILTGTDYGIGG